MRKAIYLIIIIVSVLNGCTRSGGDKVVAREEDSNYIQQLRLEYAAKLLVEQPEMSIVQIAAECGFGSHKYFTERFRLHFSMTPSEFRKASQQSENPADDATDEA